VILFDIFSLSVVLDVKGFSFFSGREVFDIFVGKSKIVSNFQGFLDVVVLVGVSNANHVELLFGGFSEIKDHASLSIIQTLFNSK